MFFDSTSFDIDLLFFILTLLLVVILVVYTSVEFILPAIGIGRRAPRPPLPPLNEQQVQALQEAATRMRRRRIENQNEDQDCVICLGQFENPVELLDCGHLFCSECFVALFQATRRNELKCPTCRSEIKLILPAFHRRRPGDNQQTAEQVMMGFPDEFRRFNNNNNHNNQDNNVMNNATHFGAVMNYIGRNFNRLPRRMKAKIVSLVVVALCYLISPVDLIQDGIPFWGMVDDVVLIVALSIVAFAIVRNTVR